MTGNLEKLAEMAVDMWTEKACAPPRWTRLSPCGMSDQLIIYN